MTIQPMGGILHLITFTSLEEKQAMLESKWLEQRFINLRNVNSKVGSLWKITWISVYGILLMAWGYKNFFKIGCVFGRIISVNYSNYDCAKNLIITGNLFTINCIMLLDVEGIQFKISIFMDIILSIKKPSTITITPTPHTGGKSSSLEKVSDTNDSGM